MSQKGKKKSSILSYWTKRYVLTLLLGLAIITVVSVIWIRHTTIEQRLDMATFIAEQTALQQSANQNPILPPVPPDHPRDPRQLGEQMYLVDEEGFILTSRGLQLIYTESIPEEILSSDETILQTNTSEGQSYYVIKAKSDDGWVVMVESKERISQVNQEYGLLAIFISALAVLGWTAVYLLTRRLTKPIKEVSDAARNIEEGTYNLWLPTDIPEQEMHDLVVSFNGMAKKLHKLETVRTELLAGVTHELKTPVTSISGLLQAVNDEVVEGDELKEFLHTALRETNRLQGLVADLLEFNAYATDSIQLTMSTHSVNALITDLTRQWEISHFSTSVNLHLSPLECDEEVEVDAMRLQQILVNVLNNASQAIQSNKGSIIITCESLESDYVKVQITDTGAGIREEEQPYIFERFFRGEQKKYQTRGLGIGLSLSRMLARSMKGELSLIYSSSEGSTFELLLIKAKDE